jgi:hypothetical protein
MPRLLRRSETLRRAGGFIFRYFQKIYCWLPDFKKQQHIPQFEALKNER